MRERERGREERVRERKVGEGITKPSV